MRERVVELVGRRANAMWVSTFHSMCVRVLRRDATTLGMKSSFSVYDTDDTRRLITLVARDLDLDPKRYTARGLAGHISNLKNELVGPGDATDAAANDFERRAAEVYVEYQRRLGLANAFDFDDLIMRTVELLQTFPDVAEYYRRRFRHVLVDEYQDTNHAQYTLVRELVGTGENGTEPGELCVVGDADQSIYAFRGATIRNIVEFERDYPQATTIMLEQNYRSTQTILSAANAVISRNPEPARQAAVDRARRRREDRRLRRRQRPRRGRVRRRRDRPADGRLDRGGRGPDLRRRRGLLPHQQPVPRVRGDLRPHGAAVPGGRRRAVLRASRGPRRAGVPAGAEQPGGHGQPAADPQRAQARHRRPGGGVRGHARRTRADLVQRGAARRGRGPGPDAEPALPKRDHGVRRAGRRAARAGRR